MQASKDASNTLRGRHFIIIHSNSSFFPLCAALRFMKCFCVLSSSPQIKAAKKHCRRASFSSAGKKCKCEPLLVPKDMGPHLVILRGYQPNAS